MSMIMNTKETTKNPTASLKFNLLNSSVLYFEALDQIKNAYDEGHLAINIEPGTLDDQLKAISIAYKLNDLFESIITFDATNGAEKVNKIIPILYNYDIEVQGIRLSQDHTIIEMGFSNSDDQYKALMILESAGL